ncbi:Sensor protein ZraS,sensory histidine kinase AtoS,Signal transduction histidine kinase involved in nitrogen fixation and metabolism regulation,phosphate regulon sensor kinase PhoR,Histidine kinase-, DNA gyrase B-, and HSP90-like ATPase [Chlamydia serpentis]|uniref:histidine kinase n=1 Tax=Chlamydia serpentis TaxID=1967782 RepID=A0A2R8FB99_9CHLA|nr:ATP-binding protein [Chlamydia serpentis]SPN73704.1 Sensor protein ZraS,sensory histidine kinase AtoS,Signal transduction histidine kinase involved in nitrogen fixation and metabolism regulation,phosphate regulon sensor kinase PhoR,Histidine kinase-, DNA gyrase B-, and HSP90-like ATPase [Chlamydia serpentis]
MNAHDPENLDLSTYELLNIKARITQSYKEASAILTAIPDGIILLSETGHFLICNSQAREILGLDENLEVLNKCFTDVLPETCLGFSIHEALKSLKIPKTLRLSLCRDSKEKEVELFIRKNEISGYLFIQIRDRSDYKQLENAIERYKNIAELGKMAATLAHEIRNPLSGIVGFASILKKEISSPRHQRMLSSIISGTRSLNNLVCSMLEYTKAQPLNLKIINLQDFFSTLIPLLSISFPNCKIEKETSQPLLRSIDPDRMNSVIWNLVKNAAETGVSPITLILHKSGEISVTNPGDIPPDIIDKLFTPFFTTKRDGNGLGLAEAQKIIRLHGGDILLKREDANVTFSIVLPELQGDSQEESSEIILKS